MPQAVKNSAKDRPTPTIEDYLAIMYVMERDGESIIGARLAESLDVAPPTVTITLKRMERDGWITTHGRKGVRLTPAGRDAARSVIRRHMLTEWMLARMLNVPWSRIHAEAHQIEHTISDEVEARLRSNLDDPQLCPHGNPLPGYEHIAMDWVQLTAFAPGDQVVIRRIHESAEEDPAVLHFLESNDLLPGRQVSVVDVLPFNQTMTLATADQQVVLGFRTAEQIFGEKA